MVKPSNEELLRMSEAVEPHPETCHPIELTAFMEKLWEQVEVDGITGCWVWTGKLRQSRSGAWYGAVYWNGNTRSTHKAAIVEWGTDVPEGWHVDHVCENTLCCCPGHLVPLTPKKNVQKTRGTFDENGMYICSNGHKVEGDNAYTPPGQPGVTKCRACRAAWQRRNR